MIFEQDSIAFRILDVLELDQENVNLSNSGRNFDALSFRYNANTRIRTNKQSLTLRDNAVCFFPSHVNYIRESNKDRLIVIHFNALDYRSAQIECFYPKNPQKYAVLFRRALDCWKGNGTAYKYETAAILYCIFTAIYEENKTEQEKDPRIIAACRYLNENYNQPDLLIRDAALQSNVSEVYFRRLFQQIYHISPKQYVLRMRIDHAIALIETGYFSLEEIAHQSGFFDYKHFSVTFKRLTGVSPSEYRYHFDQIV